MLEIALDFQKKSNDKLGKVLLLLGFITEDMLTKNLSEYFGIEYKELGIDDIDLNIEGIFPKYFTLNYGMLPFKEEDNKIYVCLSDPLANEGIEEIKKIYGKEIKPFVCSKSKIILAASVVYKIQPVSNAFVLQKNF